MPVKHPPQAGAVLPTDPATPGSDPYPYPALLDQVRTAIGDGQPSYATSPFGLVRSESLTQQIPDVVSPTETTFYVLWSSIPLGKNVTVQAIPGTIAAYVDGATIPLTVANSGIVSDVDVNGNFTLNAAPQTSLTVTYGWQIFADADLYQMIDQARQWLINYQTLETVPDALQAALVQYASYLACTRLARQLALPDVTAGEAKEALSQVAKQYQQMAGEFLASAQNVQKAFYTSGDEPLLPVAVTQVVNYPRYQPFR